MYERTVTLKVMDGFADKTPGLISPVVSDALGYLCAWGAGPGDRYKHVTILCQDDGCISAVYGRTDRQPLNECYQIFALRNEKDGVQVAYSFHS